MSGCRFQEEVACLLSLKIVMVAPSTGDSFLYDPAVCSRGSTKKVCLKFFVTLESSLERKTRKLLSRIYAEGVVAIRFRSAKTPLG